MKLSEILNKLPKIHEILTNGGAERICVHNVNSIDLMESNECPFPLLVYGNIDIADLAVNLEDLLGCKVDIRKGYTRQTYPSSFAQAAIDLPIEITEASRVLLSLFNKGDGYGKHRPPFSSVEEIEFDDLRRPALKRPPTPGLVQELSRLQESTFTPYQKALQSTSQLQPHDRMPTAEAVAIAVSESSPMADFFLHASATDLAEFQAALHKYKLQHGGKKARTSPPQITN